jgi:phosphoribosylformimino-5-aminoimidazole carboxamide ribotide isomerase
MRNDDGPAADVHADSIALVEKYVEGLCQGIDEELVERLGEWASVPCTYAGGAKGEWE